MNVLIVTAPEAPSGGTSGRSWTCFWISGSSEASANILKNETLFRCGLFPETRACELTDSEAATLVDQAVALSRRWLDRKRRGESLDTRVYRHKQCERCGYRIVRGKLGDSNRITDWSPVPV